MILMKFSRKGTVSALLIFFDKYGDAAFRQIEHQLLLERETLTMRLLPPAEEPHVLRYRVYKITRCQYLYPDDGKGSFQSVEKH